MVAGYSDIGSYGHIGIMATRLQLTIPIMRCPECNTPYEANAAACTRCGLLLLKLAPHRRAEDLSTKKRRAADQMAPCKFCGSEIPASAIRCRQCSEIVNDDFYRERAQRTRSRINHASWVAYIFGLGALLVFRPVGLVSIGAGLLLSILYYAIPVEPPPSKRNPRKRLSLWQRIKQQTKLERVSIQIPNLPKKKLVFVGTPLIAAIIGYSANALLLQQPVNDVLRSNPAAFSGMEISAHYQYYMVPGVVVYDLRTIGVRQTPIDVHTAFLEFAKKLRDNRYKRVELSYRGTTKFSIDGASFHKIGDEYNKRNFDYVLYTVPRLFHREGSASAPASSTSDRDALLQFHRQWYGDDQLTRSVANGM